MPWRTEPKINEERQQFLANRREVKPDLEKGIYPFRDGNGSVTLNRADVEWLLATHADGTWVTAAGSMSHSGSGNLHFRQGLDLRGANLRGVNLSRLPLFQTYGGLESGEWHKATYLQREAAALHLEEANLGAADLDLAALRSAHLEGAILRNAVLTRATLRSAQLGGVELPAADLRGVYFDSATTLADAVLGDLSAGFVRLADVRWGDVNLSTVDWSRVPKLGDDSVAQRARKDDGKRKPHEVRLAEFSEAVRANRQLSAALRGQGLNEQADRFAYKAQLLQRQVLLRQKLYGRALWSWLLDAVAGYGYKPVRSVFTYLLVVLTFAAAYFTLTNFALTPYLPSRSSSLAWYEAIVLSVSSFHGRGLFPTGLSLGDPLAILAAGEAIMGLLIEITFIATFTQRFFAR